LWVPDVDRAASFFTRVLGWRYGPSGSPAGRHVQGLTLHHGIWGGIDPPTLFCCFAVDDLVAATARVAAAGGAAERPQLEPFGLVSECTDDQGTPFAMFEPPGGVALRTSSTTRGSGDGDLAYVTMEVADSARARAFYGSVLAWRFSSGRVADGWQVDDIAPMVGLSDGHEIARTVPMYRVDDIVAAVEAVRSAGGAATDPEQQPYGITASCTDDQGTHFYLGQLLS
jgi:predicted enzyme related to lactoylglutathione lyase